MQSYIHLNSEIGRLKKVLVHKPGKELENLSSEYLNRLLFDDIPNMRVAIEEHNDFVEKMINTDIEVVYLEDLVEKLLINTEIKEKFIEQLLNESIVRNEIKKDVKEYLLYLNNENLVDIAIQGITYRDLDLKKYQKDYPFVLEPMANLYFTRDPLTVIDNKIIVNSMKEKIRKRETLFGKLLIKHHPSFKVDCINLEDEISKNIMIEGGDILVLSNQTILIGESQRTNIEAIKILAEKLLSKSNSLKRILIFSIPKVRSYMHLDTVLSMIDKNKFIIYHGIMDKLKISEVTWDYKQKEIIITEKDETVHEILSKAVGGDVEILQCANGEEIHASREQWNDGVNVLALAPGKVIAYDRNYITNEMLYKNSIEVLTIKSSELSRGRGGPRCMSMPLVRALY